MNNTYSVLILPDDDCDPAIELSKTRSCPSGMYPFEILTSYLQCNNLKMIQHLFPSNSLLMLTNLLCCIHFLKIPNLQTYEIYPSQFKVFLKVDRCSYSL